MSARYTVREMTHGPAGYHSVVVQDFGTCADANEIAGRFGHLVGEPIPDFIGRLKGLRRGHQVVIGRPKLAHATGGGDIVIQRAPSAGASRAVVPARVRDGTEPENPTMK